MSAVVIRLALLIAAAAVLWTFSLPVYVDIALFVGLFIVSTRAAKTNLALLAASASMFAGGLQLFLAGRDTVLKTHYREHEKYAQPDGRYVAGVNDVIDVPHGDLPAIDPLFPPALFEARRVHFSTDSLGFRNDHEFRPGDTVLLGDSYLVGNGIDQRDTLPGRLAKAGVSVYSLGYPFNPIVYERRASWFLEAEQREMSFAAFFFEGNDFLGAPAPADVPTAGRLERIENAYDTFRGRFLNEHFPFLSYPAPLFGLTRRLERLFAVSNGKVPVEMMRVGPRTIGILRDHANTARYASPALVLDGIPQVWSRVRCAFFIPEKARVYSSLAGSPFLDPPPALTSLRERMESFGVAVVDLTPTLTAAAREKLAGSELVYWADDTHWNPAGIESVIGTVRACIDRPSSPRTEPYRREAHLIHAFGRDYRIAQGGNAALDASVEHPFGGMLEGWAANDLGSTVGVSVVAFRDDKAVSAAVPRIARPDVAAVLGDNAATAGFRLFFPSDTLERWREELSVFALKDGIAVELRLPGREKHRRGDGTIEN